MGTSTPWRTPGWWRTRNAVALGLSPLGMLWGMAAQLRQRLAAKPHRVAVPVICVGNAVAGGAGKTPVVLSLLKILPRIGLPPHALTRGYGGAAHAQPYAVHINDDPAKVGDEALLLRQVAPCWVGADRVASARDAAAHDAKVVVMDDGWQSPYLHKDLSLLVVDGVYGIGNGFCLPAGPLREPWPQALARADAVVQLGDDEHRLLEALPMPVFRARLLPDEEAASRWRGKQVIAFAGIGRPEKFFATLESLGVSMAAQHSFADHHSYSDAEMQEMAIAAKAQGVPLMTTEKDWVRLSREWQKQVRFLPIQCVWDNPERVTRWLAEKLG